MSRPVKDFKFLDTYQSALDHGKPIGKGAGQRTLISALVELFSSLELMLKELCEEAAIDIPRNKDFMGFKADALRKERIIPDRLYAQLDSIRTLRNMVFHAMPGYDELSEEDYRIVENQVHLLVRWFLTESTYGPKLSHIEAKKYLDSQNTSTHLPRRIFLCYAKEDFEKVEKLYESLKERGHVPWMDKKNLLPGQNWENEIRKAIQGADLFIACMSRQSVSKRGFVQKEVQFALDVLGEIPHGQIFLIPVRLEPCKIPDHLRSFQWVDFDSNDFRERLYKAIELG